MPQETPLPHSRPSDCRIELSSVGLGSGATAVKYPSAMPSCSLRTEPGSGFDVSEAKFRVAHGFLDRVPENRQPLAEKSPFSPLEDSLTKPAPPHFRLLLLKRMSTDAC